MNEKDLTKEASKLETLLKDKTVSSIARHRNNELLIKFSDGTSLFVDNVAGKLEFSVTGQ